jgi:predicted RND superfamily exporter protein
MFMITGLLYRRLIYLVLVTLTSVSAIVVSLAVFGIFGFRINIFSVVTPPLVITLGIIGILHIINEYENLLKDNKGISTTLLAKQALSNVIKPAFYATLTTIIGFASLFTSPTAALKEFSLLASAGVLFLFLFSFLFSSLLLPLQKKPGTVYKKDIGFWMGNFSEHIIKRSAAYVVFSIGIVVLSVAGMGRLNNDMSVIDYFPKDNQVIVDHEFMLKNWGEYYPVDLTLEAKDTAGFRNGKLVQALLNFDKELSSNPLVKGHFDFTVLMERYAQITFRKELGKILESPLMAKPFINGFLNQLKAKSNGIITPDMLKARLIFTVPVVSIREMERNFSLINDIAKKHFHGVGTMSVSGYPSLYIKVMNYAFDSMKSSLYTSFLLVLVTLILMLRNIRTAIIALVPNVFPVILLLGFLGFSRINLDLATCTVTAIVMGIAIDDTIYFLHKYREARKKKSTVESIRATHHSVGKVILVSSVVMIAGFGIMMFASIKTVIYFGLLSIISVIAAFIGDLVILPLLLKYFDKKDAIKT